MKVPCLLFLTAGLIFFVLLVSNIMLIPLEIDSVVYAQGEENTTTARGREIPGASFAHNAGNPVVNDPKLKVETVFRGLQLPTTIAFLGPNDILVLEKATGTVQRITNGKLLAKPLLKVNVASEVERGMLGIAISKNKNITNNTYVFLYFTEKITNNNNINATNTIENSTNSNEPLLVANRVYRYEFVNGKLVNPKLLLDLPAAPGPRHNGGAIIIGPDNNLYIPIGDIDGHISQAQNQNGMDGAPPDGTGGILRITQDGKPIGNGIIGNNNPANKYYAYGIRNSFGIDFDPVTKRLWDTENGAGANDEINIVEPGFNSGWIQVQGKTPVDFDFSNLVNFGGKGKYRDPEFSWFDPVGPTKILFLNSDKLGKEYKNDIFVSTIHFGRIYHFKLNDNRSGLVLTGPLADKVADTDEETKGMTFGSDFGGISDMTIGPDGYLYVVSLGRGTIYRIVPTTSIAAGSSDVLTTSNEQKKNNIR
jgi:glucose/arabinose dehydrogenase